MPIIRHHLIGRDTCDGSCQTATGCLCLPQAPQTCCERNNVMDCNQGRRCPDRKPLQMKPNGLIAQFLRLMRGLK